MPITATGEQYPYKTRSIRFPDGSNQFNCRAIFPGAEARRWPRVEASREAIREGTHSFLDAVMDLLDPLRAAIGDFDRAAMS